MAEDVSDLIEEYREQLPFSDQVTVMDPPKHTEHRALLMGLITPKRLKSNEDFMWRHADAYLEPYLAAGGSDAIRASRCRSRSGSSPTCSASRRRTAPSSPAT